MVADHLALAPRREPFTNRFYELLNLLYDSLTEWFLSILTGKARLERLLESTSKWRAYQIAQLESCIQRGDGYQPDKAFRSDEELEKMLEIGTVRSQGDVREMLKERLSHGVQLLDTYDELVARVEALRSERYDREDEGHEALLMEFWGLAMPEEPLRSRCCKQWQYIGFQGDDPATDFRGMGLLGLHQLVFFAKTFPEAFQQLLTLSHHPQIGFPLAIAGITMTSLTRHLLETGRLKNHLYNVATSESLNIASFHRAYCRVFILFADFWRQEHPPSIMVFNTVRVDFERRLARVLSGNDVNLHEIAVKDL